MGSTRLRARRRALTTAWERFRDTGSAPEVRPEVIASWGRSRSALTRPVEAAPLDPSDAVQAAWADSPLRAAIAEVAEDVSRTARDCDLVAAVTDGSGRILWQTGSHHMRDRAETVNFVPGGHWDEASVGTNALDLALRTGHPAMVFSAEHFNPAVHQWVCYAAPLVDRTDGTVLGVLDLSSTWERSNPMALGTVTAFARTVSHALTARAERSRPLGTGPAPGAAHPIAGHSVEPLRLEVIGRPRVWQDGLPVMLSLRQAEILLALACHPQGLTIDQLVAHVYGDLPVAGSTAKAEVSRLRRVLPGSIASRPYRLVARATVDALEVLDLVGSGEARAAARACTDDVLAGSEAPIARELDVRLAVAVRTLVLRSADPEALAVLATNRPDDLEVVDQALTRLDPRAGQRALLAGRRAATLLG